MSEKDRERQLVSERVREGQRERESDRDGDRNAPPYVLKSNFERFGVDDSRINKNSQRMYVRTYLMHQETLTSKIQRHWVLSVFLFPFPCSQLKLFSNQIWCLSLLTFFQIFPFP